MRKIPVLLLVLALMGCDLLPQENSRTPVDAASLGPLTGRERALLFAANGAAAQGNDDAAERDYLTAAAMSTGHVEAHLALARLYQKKKQLEQARTILADALTLQPTHALANYMLGKLELAAGRYAQARQAFTQGLISEPQQVDLMMGQAVANDMLGQHRAAQALYQQLIKAQGKVAPESVHANLAMSFLLGGEPQKAVTQLKAIAKKPGASAVTRHNLALAYGMLGRQGDARAILRGDLDEETRLLAVARLKTYIAERAEDATVPPFSPQMDAAPL